MLNSEQNRPRPRVLVVSNDPIGAKVAGLGMRYLEIARALSQWFEVTLAVPEETTLTVPGLAIARYWDMRPESLQGLVEQNDVALISGYMIYKFSFLHTTPTRLVVDLITPFVLENLHYFIHEPIGVQAGHNSRATEVTNWLARYGDFFICGSERQRDFWLGVLAANYRINPHTFGQDDLLRYLIDVVGFGLPDHPPRRRKPILRDVHPKFGLDTKIVWWGGGMWDWLDSVTLARAWPKVLERHPEARLVYLLGHPNPLVPRHKIADETQRIVEDLGERDKTVFFLDWLTYDDRESLLCEADVGAVLHPLHLETRFSARTRPLDFIWARLPILITEGDVMSEFVQEHQLGRVVPEKDAAAVAAALCDLLARPKSDWSAAFEAVIENLQWPNVVAPLRRYCLEGGYAADRPRRPVAAPTAAPRPPADTWANRLALARHVWRTEGTWVLLQRVWQYLLWCRAQHKAGP